MGLPTTYWLVDYPGCVVRVTEEIAEQLTNAIEDGIVRHIRIIDLAGTTCHMVLANINVIYKSTPESRAFDRALNDSLEDEAESDGEETNERWQQ